MGGKSVSRGRAFRQGILPWRKGIDILVDARYAACRPRLTAAQGPRVEQRAILARTRCATAARRREPKSREREIPHRAGFSELAHASVRPEAVIRAIPTGAGIARNPLAANT